VEKISERKYLIYSKMNWKGDEETYMKDVYYFSLVFCWLFCRIVWVEPKMLGERQGCSNGQSLIEGK